jgi:hypothetical protein
MIKHYILNLNPTAKYEWDRCTLRDPITAEHPALAELVAKAIADPGGNSEAGRTGAYLVAVQIEVNVLEKAAIAASSSSHSPAEVLELPAPALLPKLAELVAEAA